jgi:hypothetical protein
MIPKAKKKAHPQPKKRGRVHVQTARHASGAVVAHGRLGQAHAVGIGDLRVMIAREDEGCWFARGLEIDFAEQGTSIEDVQERFEASLADTIREHLTVRGNIRGLLRNAPQDVWDEYFHGVDSEQFTLTCVTAHKLLPPLADGKSDGKRVTFFDKIAYATPVEAVLQD